MFEFIAGCVVGFVVAIFTMTVGMVLERKRWEP
jgi:hypothetical protein